MYRARGRYIYIGSENIGFLVGCIFFLLLGVWQLTVNRPIDLAYSAQSKFSDGQRGYVSSDNYSVVMNGDGYVRHSSTTGGSYTQPMDGYMISLSSGQQLEILVVEGKLDGGKVDLYGKFIPRSDEYGQVIFVDTGISVIEYYLSFGFWLVLSLGCLIAFIRSQNWRNRW